MISLKAFRTDLKSSTSSFGFFIILISRGSDFWKLPSVFHGLVSKKSYSKENTRIIKRRLGDSQEEIAQFMILSRIGDFRLQMCMHQPWISSA
ncbi:hypothetical protein L2E82_21071 [Cichorium intybus]|uniref:Uncharacterized protein n=1 Tax=Cichorium intybus TaxID=13427 RepID=A0ACB9DV46_CICIN|nr:hypothetical protein L2E82_21071 [Cichorium intybus]